MTYMNFLKILPLAANDRKYSIYNGIVRVGRQCRTALNAAVVLRCFYDIYRARNDNAENHDHCNYANNNSR